MIDDCVLLTVRAHEVERGDVLFGFRDPVEQVLFNGADGRWYFYDRFGSCICRRPRFWEAKVWRGGLSVDDCPPHGIERPDEATGTGARYWFAPMGVPE